MSVSSSTPEPRPGPSRSSLLVEKPVTVTTVYLMKDYKFRIRSTGQSIPKSGGVLNLKKFRSDSFKLEGEHRQGPSPYVASIADYVEKLKAERRDQSALLTLKLRQRVDRTRARHFIFEVEMDEDFVREMRSLLPFPSLEIKGKVEVIWNFADLPTLTQFGKLVELKAETKLSNSVSDPIPRSRLMQSGSDMRFSVILSIVIGWQPPQRPDERTTALKLNTDSFLQTLFTKDFSKDVTIVVESEAEIKCHRLIFTAHSPVLAAMLSPDNGMREGQTGRMVLTEISEEGVRQLLRYLYCMEVDTSKLSCEVAVELFKTAHLYELTHLMDSLRGQLLRRGKEWYEPGVLLELYYHVRYLRDFEKLRDHLLRVMASMPREIRSCERFKELNQADALDLTWKLVESPRIEMPVKLLSRFNHSQSHMENPTASSTQN